MSATIKFSVPGNLRPTVHVITEANRERLNLSANRLLRSFARRKGVSIHAVDVDVKVARA